MIDPAIVKYCHYQERCQSEVRSKLYELGLRKTAVEEQISELIQAGLINEERFARAYARGKWRMLHWGKNKIKYELSKKQISEYCIRKAMTEIDEDNYQSLLDGMVLKKWQATKGRIPLRKQKVITYLHGKGYDYRDIQDSLKRQEIG